LIGPEFTLQALVFFGSENVNKLGRMHVPSNDAIQCLLQIPKLSNVMGRKIVSSGQWIIQARPRANIMLLQKVGVDFKNNLNTNTLMDISWSRAILSNFFQLYKERVLT